MSSYFVVTWYELPSLELQTIFSFPQTFYLLHSIQSKEIWKIWVKAPFWFQLSILIEPLKKRCDIILKIWVQNVPSTVKVGSILLRNPRLIQCLESVVVDLFVPRRHPSSIFMCMETLIFNYDRSPAMHSSHICHPSVHVNNNNMPKSIFLLCNEKRCIKWQICCSFTRMFT
jgi:hypothetical protein